MLYDSRHLVTHALCVGMTGSGKTGAVPFAHRGSGHRRRADDRDRSQGGPVQPAPDVSAPGARGLPPWIDEDEARRAGLTPDAYAAQQADTWKQGLADWGQDGARIERLRAAADFAIYTPGSRPGRPLSILSSFWRLRLRLRGDGPGTDDAEALADRASTTAMGVLTLAGVEAEMRGREHTFLSALLAASWKAGRDLDLAALIQGLQSPPFEKVGVLDVDAFYPSKERFGLATKLNAVLASPGFEQWLEGEPLDAGRLLYGPKGKPRVSIISIAHLDDAHRMFFVSLLLNEIVAWMRRQSGTSSLRAIVYMDEIAGYFPPVANPPAKAPLLTLLKQGRAFGVGVVLATQNTVDLDYKGLGNTGTWFLGRLQTERDKARVLDGLEGAAGGSLDRAAADKTLSALGKRVFLLHDVHAGAPITFQSRWAMSYLRGPLSRDQIRDLMATDKGAAEPAHGDLSHGKTGTQATDQHRPTDRRRRVLGRLTRARAGRPAVLPAVGGGESELHARGARRGARDVCGYEAEDQRDARCRRGRADRRRGGAGGLGAGGDPRARAG